MSIRDSNGNCYFQEDHEEDMKLRAALLRGKAEKRMTYGTDGKEYSATETKIAEINHWEGKILGIEDKQYIRRVLKKIYESAYAAGARDAVADMTGYYGYTTCYE